MDNPEEKKSTANQVGLTRREFLGSAVIGGAALVGATALSGCTGPDNLETPESSGVKPPITHEEKISPIEQEFKNSGLILVKDPGDFPTENFILGVGEYPYAIQEGSPFIGPYKLTYSAQKGVFPEVTFLHHKKEEEIPVAGQILPILYPMPKEIKECTVVPYSVSNQNQREKEIELNPANIYYLVPIVTAGDNDGILPIKDQSGKIVSGGSYEPFKIEEVSGTDKGYLSWALLSFDQQDITMVGVVRRSKMKINPDSTPVAINNMLSRK